MTGVISTNFCSGKRHRKDLQVQHSVVSQRGNVTFVLGTISGANIKMVNVARRKKLHSSQPFEYNYVPIN